MGAGEGVTGLSPALLSAAFICTLTPRRPRLCGSLLLGDPAPRPVAPELLSLSDRSGGESPAGPGSASGGDSPDDHLPSKINSCTAPALAAVEPSPALIPRVSPYRPHCVTVTEV